MKGTTIIELTDINTGEVKVTKDENFITNALKDLCQPILKNHDTLYTAIFSHEGSCSIESLMRGLIMFDSQFEENTAKYFPSNNEKMIGHGSDATYTGSDLTMGSFNFNQSITSGDSERVYVWDFTSEQANGMIKSVCLSTQLGGHIGHGSKTPLEETSTTLRPFSSITKSIVSLKYVESVYPHERVPFYLSFKNDFIVHGDISKMTAGTITFYKTHLNSNKIDIFNKFPSYTLSAGTDARAQNIVGEEYTKVEIVTLDLSGVLGTGLYFGVAHDGQHLYVTSKSNAKETTESNAWAPGTSINLIKINLETFEYEVLSVTNTTGVSLAIRATYERMTEGAYTFGVSNGHMFVRSWVSTGGSNVSDLYAINLSNNTDVKQVKDANGLTKVVGVLSTPSEATPFAMSINGKVAFSSSTTRQNTTNATNITLKVVDNTMFIVNHLGATLRSIYTHSMDTVSSGLNLRAFATDNPLYFGTEERQTSTTKITTANIRICVTPNVLMTINNLTNPVEKTPAQTMRVTYKLTKE